MLFPCPPKLDRTARGNSSNKLTVKMSQLEVWLQGLALHMRHMHTNPHRQQYRHSHSDTQRQTDRYMHTDICTDIYTDTYAHRHTDIYSHT